MRIILALTTVAIALVAGCVQELAVPPAAPPRAVAHVQPPDWFHQQLAAACAARRNHRPQADTVGAQKAYVRRRYAHGMYSGRFGGTG